jgi:hypothetical protein
MARISDVSSLALAYEMARADFYDCYDCYEIRARTAHNGREMEDWEPTPLIDYDLTAAFFPLLFMIMNVWV